MGGDLNMNKLRLDFIRKNILDLLTLSALFVFVGYMSFKAPWLGDEMLYQLNYDTEEPIRSIWDIFVSQNAHYMEINGRYVAHFLVQLFLCLIGRAGFAFFNALVTVLFVLLLKKYSRVKGDSLQVFSVISCLVIISFQTKFVPTCQIGYIWMFSLTLLILLVFFYVSKIEKQLVPFVAVLAMVAGEGHEALNIGVCGSLLFYVIKNRCRLSKLQWVILFFYFLGTLILIISPGNYKRLSGQTPVDNSVIYSLFCIARSLRVTYILIVSLVLARYLSYRFMWKQFYDRNQFEIIVIAILLIFNLLISVQSNRQLFGIELMAIIILTRLLYEYCRTIIYPLLLVGLLVCSYIVWKDVLILKARCQDVYNIERLYLCSRSGDVYYDLNRISWSFEDNNPCSPLYFSWVISKYNNFLKKFNKEKKKLAIYPTILKNHHLHRYWSIDRYGNVLVICKDRDDTIYLHRSVSILWNRYQLQDFVLEKDGWIKKDGFLIQMIPSIPFISNDSVTISERKV